MAVAAADDGDDAAWNDADDAVSGRTLRAISYFHANEYLRLPVSQHPDPSSNHRLATYRQLYVNASTLDDARQLLGDTSDARYPIYRRGTPSDEDYTLATALFVPSEGVMRVYESNPREGAPARVFPLRRGLALEK